MTRIWAIACGLALTFPAAPAAALAPAPSPSVASRAAADSVGLWDSGYGAAMSPSDCGRWTLDAAGFCTADDVRNGVELGVKFQTSTVVRVTGVRVYRVDLGTVTGTLRDGDGTRLATGTFAPASGTGWQDLTFSSPVTIRPGRTYLASYYSPATRYAFRYGYFSGELTRGPITALRSVQGDPNGVHCYDVATCSYPRAGFRDSTYWVTPLWQTPAGEPTPPAPEAPVPPTDVRGPRIEVMVPTKGTTRVRRNRTIRITFTEPVRAALLTRATVRLLRTGNRAQPVRMRYDARKDTLTLRPRGGLRPGSRYRVVVSTAVADVAGNPLDQDPAKPGSQPATWTFRTR